jgi:hypothetical protein
MTVEFSPATEAEEIGRDLIPKHHGHLIGARSEEFFVIELSAQHWKELTESQKRALVDHELEHCIADEDDNGNSKLGIAPHDVEEFASVLKRHGLWRSDLRSFAKIAQGKLALEEE